LAEAVGCYQTTVQLNPTDADAYNNMAVAHKDRGEIPEAIDAHRKALAHNPNYHSAHSNLLLAMHYDCDCENHSIFSESQNWWRQHGAPVAGRNIHCNHPDPGRRLNVGYVSSDFRQHSVSYFFLPLLACHDRKNVNVFCYSGVGYPDRMTEKIKNLADHWRSFVGMSPEAVAEQIETDGIDILVDLSGHTAGHRLLAFARKPAPIQVTWLGYPNSTGMPVMDYRLSDAIADPPGDSDCYHSETVIRLTNGFLCYLPPEITPQVNDLPARRTGRITFGSFNTLPKVNSYVIAAWSEILMKVAGSRLFLKCKQLADKSIRLSFLDKFSQQGIASDRITLLPQTPTTQEHLALYNDIDIGLDPFPYNGTTTTCEALWMGVPVVTLKGERHSSRVGASILTRLELEELIAESPQAYVDKTVALSADLPRLGSLRNEMRHRMTHSSLCDANAFAEQIETSYRVMWHKWCEQA
jgi:predicted O-linked N-acetylglucosamine transferase (SPINDLY family)